MRQFLKSVGKRLNGATGLSNDAVEPKAPALQNGVEPEAPAPHQSQTLSDFSQLYDPYGVLQSSKNLTDAERALMAFRYSYGQRAEIAMTICSMLPEGDYFEFGSDGLGTFRNFLTAFDIRRFGKSRPTTRFYAFDIFGKGAGAESNQTYFNNWSDANGSDKLAQAYRYLNNHDLFTDRCILKQGFFQDTLTAEFKDSYLAEERRIGTLFLDCNIRDSYKVVFDWSIDVVSHTRCFVYMDEYYCTKAVRGLFDEYCAELKNRYGMRADFVRNAGGFGALFLLMQT